jgi:hypothetical protein
MMIQKRGRLIAAVAASLAIAAIFAACSSLDVVGKDSARAFGDVLGALSSEGGEEGIHYLVAPDGEARFSWGEEGASIAVDAAPFVAAGLDLSKLQNAGDGEIVFAADYGLDIIGSTDPAEAFSQLVSKHRDILNYHSSLDHYGAKLGGGNMFEWAKDMKTNGYDNSAQDKDIVFVLNPEPLIAAGADPERIAGWTYAQVPIEENGKTEQVWKLLKPFDLK